MHEYFSCRFGSGTGQIWRGYLNCRGSESRLISCSNGGIRYCRHSDDVAIYCAGNPNVVYAPNIVFTVMHITYDE